MTGHIVVPDNDRQEVVLSRLQARAIVGFLRDVADQLEEVAEALDKEA